VAGVVSKVGTAFGEVTKVANTSPGGALALPARVAFSCVPCSGHSLHSTGTKGRRAALEWRFWAVLRSFRGRSRGDCVLLPGASGCSWARWWVLRVSPGVNRLVGMLQGAFPGDRKGREPTEEGRWDGEVLPGGVAGVRGGLGHPEGCLEHAQAVPRCSKTFWYRQSQ